MNKEDIVDALIQAGIVSSSPDGKGAKLFVTINDFDETMADKIERERRNIRALRVQFWLSLITAICLLVTTAFSVFSYNKSEKHKYFQRNGYILRYSPQSGTLCAIPENEYSKNSLKMMGVSFCKK